MLRVGAYAECSRWQDARALGLRLGRRVRGRRRAGLPWRMVSGLIGRGLQRGLRVALALERPFVSEMSRRGILRTCSSRCQEKKVIMGEVRSRGRVRRASVLVALSVGAGLLVPVKRVEADPACSGRYDISVPGIVLDKDTGLTWQRAEGGADYTHANAKTYCSGLNLNGTGWRLPTVFELQTIVDESRTNPAIDLTVFDNTISSPYWSSSSFAGSPADAWAVNFGGGSVSSYYVDNAFRVRCVR